MPPSSESYTFAKKSLRLESQISRHLTTCLYLFVFPLSFATRSVGIVIMGPVHVLKSQNKSLLPAKIVILFAVSVTKVKCILRSKVLLQLQGRSKTRK